MNSLNSRRSDGSRYIKRILILTFLFFLIFLVGPIRGFVNKLVSPIFSLGKSFYESSHFIPGIFKSKVELLDQIADLEKENFLLQLKESDYNAVYLENRKLKEELRIDITDYHIRASVVARSPQTPFDTMILDKGSRDGVEKGDLVLVSDKTAIGEIVEVGTKTSTLKLNSYDNFKHSGIVSRNGQILEVVGKSGGNMETFVPNDFDINIGDSLVLIDSNLTFAVVGSIEESDTLGNKKVLMVLPISTKRVETVYILDK